MATALKAQHCNEGFEGYGKERNGKVRYSESVRERERQDRCDRHCYLTGLTLLRYHGVYVAPVLFDSSFCLNCREY
jgi:hypothetical protein